MSNLERVAILGASGWVGRTACNWLAKLDTQVLMFAASSRVESIGGTDYQMETFDLRKIRDFKPTTVIDAAFITREKVGTLPLARYISLNTLLIEQALELQRLPTIEKFIGMSSGAAVPHLKLESKNLSSDPYGSLKATYEQRLMENAELRAKTTIGRIWSVSGSFVTKPSLFAFSSLIQQALAGHVEIQARHRVWRRYVDLKDFIRVITLASPDDSRVIDSGGRKVEIEQLAELIFALLGINPSIKRVLIPGSADDLYFSNESTWLDAAQHIGFVPLTLEEQIVKVAATLQTAN
jgi:nucleoside-diphosphate-sugar epimerase